MVYLTTTALKPIGSKDIVKTGSSSSRWVDFCVVTLILCQITLQESVTSMVNFRGYLITFSGAEFCNSFSFHTNFINLVARDSHLINYNGMKLRCSTSTVKI